MRLVVLILAIAVSAMALGARSSSAGTFGQALLVKAAAMIGVNVAPATQALDPESTAASSMATERRGHTATRLQDGRVLIAGGENSTGALNGTEVFDPADGAFSAAGNMGAARVDHAATLLADGRVLITGGRNGSGPLATTELFDSATGTFASGPSLGVARAGHSATLLGDGRILIAGGDANGTAEIIDASLSGSTATGALGTARSMHSAAVMQDGRVLIVGGRDASGNLSSGEIFSNGGFTAVDGSLKVARARALLRVLFDGKVQIIGGSNDGSMEIYDPSIATFGAYAHVLPEGDTCAGLPGQIQISQTRAALFHNGQSDPIFDRSSHTINETSGAALVVGGVNSGGTVLSSTEVFNSSNAQLSTDKLDYSPGETAHISGRGFQPGETVRLKIHEDPHTPQERGLDVTADASGNFTGDYLVMNYDIDMKFIVGARGLTSGLTAQTTFTDANPQTIAVAAPTSATVLQGATANYGNVTVTVGGSTGACTVTLGTTALPAGAAAVFGSNPTSTTGANITSTLSVTTSASTPAGTYTFQVTGTNSGAGCQGPGATPSNTVTLIVNAATVNTTTTVANATATFGDSSVTLNATVTPASGPAVNNGSVTFTVKQGATTIGVATTDNTIVAGAASVSYTLPPGTAAGPYTIEASYTPGAGFNSSSGTGSLTINNAGSTTTITCAAGSVYTGSAIEPCTYTVTGNEAGNPVLVAATAVPSANYTNNVNAGVNTASASFTFAGDANHNGSSDSETFSIDKAGSTTTVTCAAGSVYTGSAIEPCTYTVTGNEAGNPILVAATAVPSANYTNNVNAGVNTASASFTFAGDANHNGSSDSETFSIDKRTLTASIINDPTKVYDGNADATLAPGNFSLANLVAGQNFTVTKTTGTYNSPNVAAANLVSTTLAASDFTPTGGANPNNYNLPTSASGPGHILAKPLTITADNKSFLFGDPLPSLTASYNAFVPGEGVGNLGGSLIFTIKNASNVVVPYNSSTPSGTYTIIPSGLTSTNYAITFVNGTLTIGAWTITGFYQPVDMNTSTMFIWNTIKGGSTVPLKFNIYAGPIGPLTERKNVSDVMFGTIQVADIPCNASSGLDVLVDYVTNTGNTTLRYDTTGAQFIQNWQTPKAPNKCYQVRMTALDGSHIDAYFKTK